MRTENQIEMSFIEKLRDLKYTYRNDIRDKASLEANFRDKFEKLNKVRLSDAEFTRLKDSIITSDVFEAAKILRETNTFKRDDDTPLQYTMLIMFVMWKCLKRKCVVKHTISLNHIICGAAYTNWQKHKVTIS